VVVVRVDTFNLIVREATPAEAAAVARQAEEHATAIAGAQQAEASRRRREQITDVLSVAVIGAALGLGLCVGLHAFAPRPWVLLDLAYPAGGLVLGALYASGLRGFQMVAREKLSERLPERPGVLSKYLLPAGGFAAGAWWGFSAAGAVGATVGAAVGGLLAAPVILVVVSILADALNSVTG
jgi:hypothetical protein